MLEKLPEFLLIKIMVLLVQTHLLSVLEVLIPSIILLHLSLLTVSLIERVGLLELTLLTSKVYLYLKTHLLQFMEHELQME